MAEEVEERGDTEVRRATRREPCTTGEEIPTEKRVRGDRLGEDREAARGGANPIPDTIPTAMPRSPSTVRGANAAADTRAGPEQARLYFRVWPATTSGTIPTAGASNAAANADTGARPSGPRNAAASADPDASSEQVRL
jgi:hypothetical protein